MELEEKILMLGVLDDAIQLSNSLIDALLINGVDVAVGITQQITIDEKVQPIIVTNIGSVCNRLEDTKKLLDACKCGDTEFSKSDVNEIDLFENNKIIRDNVRSGMDVMDSLTNNGDLAV